jgi:acyl-CoA synthetase (AMP-forming)/AMP-acid ligase II
MDLASRLFSPYDLGMFAQNPLRDILAKSIDFERLRESPIKVFVTATNVRTGRGRLFRNAELAPEALLAYCTGKMAHFAIPRYVRWMDALPRNHAERVQKTELREDGVTADTWDREAHGYKVAR